MTRPTRLGRVPILSGALGSTPTVEPDPDPSDPVDYALTSEGASVQVAHDVGVAAQVQEQFTDSSTAFDVTAIFDDQPTEGNLLLAAIGSRTTSNVPTTPTGWTAGPQVVGPAFDGGRLSLFYKIAGPSESSTVTIASTSSAKKIYIAEWSGVPVIDQTFTEDDQPATTTMVAGPMTPVASAGVIFAGWNQSARLPGFTVSAPFTTSWNEGIDPSGPQVAFAYLIEDPFSGPYDATLTSTASRGWGGFLVSFTSPAGGITWLPAPAAIDEDDATYSESDGTFAGDEWLQVALAVARAISRVDLRVGMETAGSKTFELYGSDDALFTTPVLLDSVTFTATGSYTADNVTFSFVPTDSYAYYRIEQTANEIRRVYDLNMYSSFGAGGVSDHPLLTGRDLSDQHPADAIALDDTAGWFAGTDVEAALAEAAARTFGYLAHGNAGATETFDAAIAWHSATLNANCVFTLTGAPSGTVSSLVLELTQDGTGGRTIDLPASVVNGATLESEQDTTAAQTTLLLLMSRDGGTTWYGFWAGSGSSAAALTVEDEGTPLATAADTLDFVGAGVVASGTGAEKTITISGAPTGAAGGDLSGTYPNPSVVDDSHSHTAATLPAVTGGTTTGHIHVAEEIHLSDGSTTTYTLDAYYEPGSIQAWNRTAIARLLVTEILPDQVTVSAAGSSGDQIVFDYAATLI